MAVKEFNINVTMEERWIPYFQSFLHEMQSMGNAGCSRLIGFYSDGDGDFRPKFDYDIPVTLVPGITKHELIVAHEEDCWKIETSPKVIPHIMFDAG